VRTFKEKGYAFIRFDSHEVATNAIIQMHGKELCGVPCKVSWGKETGEDKDIIQCIPPPAVSQQTSLDPTALLGISSANLLAAQNPLSLLNMTSVLTPSASTPFFNGANSFC
ncbi:hypothetical protein Ciccas_010387, partial [Cichlidogyrus casuarinus]